MSDTIAAIATPAQPGAIGILRLSGTGTCAALDAVFRAKNGKKAGAQRSRTMVLGELLDETGQVIDNVLCVVFPAPHSYTGEDCAELHCHGSPIVLDAGLRALFAAGCRQATGGEFTKRAFLNGQLDLIQAESVVDLIDAETAQQAHNAVCQLDGALSRTVGRIYDELMDMAARFYAVVDYPDEDIEDLQRHEMLDTLRRAQGELESLVAGFSRGRLMKLGVPTVLLGKPNAGKSSLLNALLGYDRAIVTDVAGTTRDTVEEKAEVGGVLLRLIDTAGIRETSDEIERLGVFRSRRAMEAAELVLAVIDGSSELTREDIELVKCAERAPHGIVILSKHDLGTVAAVPETPLPVVEISSVTGEGLQELAGTVRRLFPMPAAPAGEILTNARQLDAVSRALESMKAAENAMETGCTPDIVLTETETAMAALGELSGRTVREEVTNRIFERFCVGK